jgi:uncharacterized protein (DUF1501 family)
MNTPNITRRHFFNDCAVGTGKIALASLLAESAYGAANSPNVAAATHFQPKAKAVIHMFMAGAPSQLEMFDNKPMLTKYEGKPLPPSIIGGQRYAFIRPDAAVLGPRFKFARHGQCGAELSEVLPHLATIVDDIAIVKSMHTDAFNHAPAQIFMNTGSQQFGRPSLGAWTTYGLGSESSNLPAYVVFSTGSKGTSGGASNWGAGFLPSVYNGVLFRSGGDPVLYLSNPKGVDDTAQRQTLDAIQELNRQRLGRVGDPEIATRINSFEMAYQMQSSAPELMDIRQEPQHILDLYGATPGKTTYATACLLARRLIERGTRFVQIFHEAWDQHGNLVGDLKRNCADTDRANAALIQDLKARGLLEDTLVIWGGEFGRTPMVQGGDDGRDHHPNCFSMWLAGGGIRPGMTFGASDDFGFNAAVDKVHVHDLHATVLRLLGFDHEKLTHRFQGRDFRLTDVFGEVVDKLIV